MESKRTFNRRQRAALYLAAGGHCEICGAALDPGWHADHISPYCKGGETHIENGQALCPDCNLRKGSKTSMAERNPSGAFNPRKWQKNALVQYRRASDTKRDFLLVATPGAGKTYFAGMVTAQWLESRKAEFVIVVVPTLHLRRQWANKMNDLGLYFIPDWMNRDGSPPRDAHGVCITYQQASTDTGRELLRHLVAKRPTAIILDEIHHAGEGLSWGDALRYAFENATYRLLLSGTPFRSDNNQIPFVEYGADGRSIADYNYGYGNALFDQDVVRYVIFPSYEGNLEWVGRNGEEVTATFEDSLTEQAAAERLRTAIDHRGNWVRDVIREAHQRLMSIRSDYESGDSRAGGLIIAADQRHARGIERVVIRETGTTPVVVISDMDADASATIERFASGDTPWIIAVKMVSEGVDIPRLRVGVYATNVTTELFFRQAVGRVVRWQSGFEDQPAYFYLPRDARLVRYALAMREERDHVLSEEIDILERAGQEADRAEISTSMFMPISAEARAHNTIMGDLEYTQSELSYAETVQHRIGYARVPREVIAAVIRAAGSPTATPAPPADNMPDYTPRAQHEVRGDLRRMCNRLAAKYATMAGIEVYMVHRRWIANFNGSPQPQATQDELRRKKQWLQDMIRELS